MNNLEASYKEELEQVLEDQFPKSVSKERGGALMLFAESMIRIRKAITAFGGCESCYGKGYSTSAEIGRRISFCKCARGEQLERLMSGSTV